MQTRVKQPPDIAFSPLKHGKKALYKKMIRVYA